MLRARGLTLRAGGRLLSPPRLLPLPGAGYVDDAERLLDAPRVLLLDEPTNFLDFDALDVMEGRCGSSGAPS